MPVNDVIQLRVITQLQAQMGLNVMHFRIESTTPPEPSLFNIANSMASQLGPLYKPLLASAASYRGVGVRRIRPLPVTGEFLSPDEQGPGTQTGDPLPKQTAGVISIRTGLAGQANRGRIYIPFSTETRNTDEGRPDATYVSNLSTLAAFLVNPITVTFGLGSLTLQIGVYHRAGGLITIATQMVPRLIWGTQRRRGDYGRPNTPPV